MEFSIVLLLIILGYIKPIYSIGLIVFYTLLFGVAYKIEPKIGK